MSERTGDRNFQRMAIGMMALTGIGTLLHGIHALIRDLQPKREKATAAPVRAAEPKEPPPQPAHEEHAETSWVTKARVSDRPAEGERAWSDSVSRQGHARHH